jgi:hypothetical protein
MATLERWLMRNVEILSDGPHLAASDPVDAALLYLDHVAASTDRLWSNGCLVGSLSMDLAASSERMQNCVETMFKGFVAQHAELFTALLAGSPWSEKPTPEEFAEMFLSLIEGSIVVGKSYRAPLPVARSIRSFALFARQLAGKTSLAAAPVA